MSRLKDDTGTDASAAARVSAPTLTNRHMPHSTTASVVRMVPPPPPPPPWRSVSAGTTGSERGDSSQQHQQQQEQPLPPHAQPLYRPQQSLHPRRASYTHTNTSSNSNGGTPIQITPSNNYMGNSGGGGGGTSNGGNSNYGLPLYGNTNYGHDTSRVNTTDPERVDSALIAALKEPRERHAVLQLEQVLVEFVQNSQLGWMEVGGPYNATVVISAAATSSSSSSANINANRSPVGTANDTAAAASSGSSSSTLEAVETAASSSSSSSLMMPLSSSSPNDTLGTVAAPTLPPPPQLRQSSFQRCILHRLADRFGIVREPGGALVNNAGNSNSNNTNTATTLASPMSSMLRLIKVPTSVVPQLTLAVYYKHYMERAELLTDTTTDWMVHGMEALHTNDTTTTSRNAADTPVVVPLATPRKMKIMKRSTSQPHPLLLSSKAAAANTKKASVEEKEKAYALARARIFNQDDTTTAEDGASTIIGETDSVSTTTTPPTLPQQQALTMGYRTKSQNSLSCATTTDPIVSNYSLNASLGAGGVPQQQQPKAVYRNRMQEEADPDFQRNNNRHLTTTTPQNHLIPRNNQTHLPLSTSSPLLSVSSDSSLYPQQQQQPMMQHQAWMNAYPVYAAHMSSSSSIPSNAGRDMLSPTMYHPHHHHSMTMGSAMYTTPMMANTNNNHTYYPSSMVRFSADGTPTAISHTPSTPQPVTSTTTVGTISSSQPLKAAAPAFVPRQS